MITPKEVPRPLPVTTEVVAVTEAVAITGNSVHLRMGCTKSRICCSGWDLFPTLILFCNDAYDWSLSGAFGLIAIA